MKATIIGAGAAGLSLAMRLRRRFGADVRILERAAEAETPGLGVALLPFALDELRSLEIPGIQRFLDTCVPIPRPMTVFAGQAGADRVQTATRVRDSIYWGVKRATLVGFLRDAAKAAGVRIEYGADVSVARVKAEREAADLFVGADGAGSAVRAAYDREFAPKGEESKSRFAWLELQGDLDQFVFGYIFAPGRGLIRLTAYPHAAGESSGIVTHGPGWAKFFDDAAMLEPDGSLSPAALAVINDMFAPGLDQLGFRGQRLLGGSRWRHFRATHCQTPAFANTAVIGDAFATVHFETGWGTSAALQQSRILTECIARGVEIAGASRPPSPLLMGGGGTDLLGRMVVKREDVAAGLGLWSRKSVEISKPIIATTLKTMREIDEQSAMFLKAGVVKFLTLNTP